MSGVEGPPPNTQQYVVRLHGCFQQTGTSTGRLAMNEPNLQVGQGLCCSQASSSNHSCWVGSGHSPTCACPMRFVQRGWLGLGCAHCAGVGGALLLPSFQLESAC